MKPGAEKDVDLDSAGVYFISVEEFEGRSRPGEKGSEDKEAPPSEGPGSTEVESPQKG